MKLFLSVIIPVYNLEKHIKKTLSSLIRQSDKDFELVIIDDGSTDNSYNVIKEVMDNSSLTKVNIIKQKNGGVSSARNTGIRNSKGKYLFFLDGDDYVSDDFIETLKNNIQPNIEILSWEYNKVDDLENEIWEYKSSYLNEEVLGTGETFLKNIVLNSNFSIWTGSAIYSKSLVEKNNLSFTVGSTSGEDLEFIYKALSNATNVKHIPKVLSFYMQREGSIINSFTLNRFDAIDSMFRISDYLNRKSKSLNSVSNNLSRIKIVEHYINTISSYYKYTDEACAKNLFKQIDNLYPSMRKKLNVLLLRYTNKNIKKIILSKLVLLCPNTLFTIINSKNK